MVAAVQKQTTVEAGVSVLAQSIHSQIKQVFTGVILPAPIKDQVDCIFEAIEEAKGKIAAVLLANTPYSHVQPGAVEIDEKFSAEAPAPRNQSLEDENILAGQDGRQRPEDPAPQESVVAPEGAQGEANRVPV